jgi:PhnB protein
MNNSFKPSGYNSLSPYFIVPGAQRLIDLLKKVFDAKELRRYDNADGSIMHAEIQIDDSVVMIGDASKNYPANQLLVHVYVPDVRKTFEKAIALGCTAEEKPAQKKGDPDIRGMFRDFAGNSWAVGTQM